MVPPVVIQVTRDAGYSLRNKLKEAAAECEKARLTHESLVKSRERILEDLYKVAGFLKDNDPHGNSDWVVQLVPAEFRSHHAE